MTSPKNTPSGSSHRTGALLSALASAILFGAATPLSKSLLAEIPAQVLAGLFYLGAALALTPKVFGTRSGDGSSLATLGWPTGARNRRLLLGAILFGGVLGPVLLLLGLQQAAASSVAMLLNLETVATAVLGLLLFREQLGRWSWLGNLGVFLAGVMLSFEGGQPGLVGSLLVAGAAIAWGLDNQCTALIDGISPSQSTFWKGLVAGAVNLILGLALTGATPGLAWLGALCVGALAYGISITLYISSAQVLGATRAQMVFASAPVFGVLGAVLLLGESLSPLQVGAGLLLALAISMLLLDTHEHEHQHESITHAHAHTHGGPGDDGHHDPESGDVNHGHGPVPAGTRHSHPHSHAPVLHSHPHWPDLHHRHEHA
ncbi:MAG: EamA family transporter [Planctomycetota bacterium]|nr:EamA family transporter [Planctomycetota bacterium]